MIDGSSLSAGGQQQVRGVYQYIMFQHSHLRENILAMAPVDLRAPTHIARVQQHNGNDETTQFT